MNMRRCSMQARKSWRQWDNRNKEYSNSLETSITIQEGEDMCKKWSIRQCLENDEQLFNDLIKTPLILQN